MTRQLTFREVKQPARTERDREWQSWDVISPLPTPELGLFMRELFVCGLPRDICGLAWSGRVYGGQAHWARSRHLCRINRKERATRFWLALPLILSMMSSVYGVLPMHPGSVLKASQALLFHLDFHFTTIILIFQIRNWVRRRSHLPRGTKLSSRAVL